jgi:putative membrane protein
MALDDNQHHTAGSENQNERKETGWIGFIIRFIVAALVLMVTAYLTPGFERMDFGTALLASIVIAGIDWLINKIFKLDASPFGRGISGFLISALIIYLTQFFVPDMSVSIIGAVIAALIIGLIDAIIPSRVL